MRLVEISNPAKYGVFAKEYGLLTEILRRTAVINFNGILINVAHEDYREISPFFWDIDMMSGEIIVDTYWGEKVATGIKVY